MADHEVKRETRERLVTAEEHLPPPGKSEDQAEALRGILQAASDKNAGDDEQAPADDEVNFFSRCLNNVGLRALMFSAVAWLAICGLHGYVSGLGVSGVSQGVYGTAAMLAPTAPNTAGFMMAGTDYMEGRYSNAARLLSMVHSGWGVTKWNLLYGRVDVNAAGGFYKEAVAEANALGEYYKSKGWGTRWLRQERALWNQAAGNYAAAVDDYQQTESSWKDNKYKHAVQVDHDYARSQWGAYAKSPAINAPSFMPMKSYTDRMLIDSAVLYANWAYCEVQLGRYDHAIQLCDQALSVHENCSPAYRVRALAELQLGHLDAALADCNQALHLDETYAAALVCRADVLDKMGKHDEAARDRSRAGGRT